jgi:hypothetical protein
MQALIMIALLAMPFVLLGAAVAASSSGSARNRSALISCHAEPAAAPTTFGRRERTPTMRRRQLVQSVY